MQLERWMARWRRPAYPRNFGEASVSNSLKESLREAYDIYLWLYALQKGTQKGTNANTDGRSDDIPDGLWFLAIVINDHVIHVE
jgi:hypothetical protein